MTDLSHKVRISNLCSADGGYTVPADISSSVYISILTFLPPQLTTESYIVK